MRQIYTYFALFVGLLLSACPLLAQQSQLDAAPALSQDGLFHQGLSSSQMPKSSLLHTQTANRNSPEVVIGDGGGTMQPEAMWDLNFYYDVLTSSGSGSLVGVVWTGTEYWISKWTGADSLFRFSGTGTYLGLFTVPTMGAVRALTTDGTFVYAANNTNSIKKINIATQSLVGTFTVPAAAIGGGATRWITYDPTGTGGFWIGNFNTDIVKINNPASGTATILQTITAATHGATGMYGAAYDGTSLGGPYLWVFSQTDPYGSYSTATLSQLKLSTTAFTGVGLDVNTFVGLLPNNVALAGGMSIGTGIPGTTLPTMLCMIQGVGLVGFELNFPANDVKSKSVEPTTGYTQVPNNQISATPYQVTLQNHGNAATSGVSSTIKIYDGVNFNLLATLNSGAAVNLAQYATQAQPSSATYTLPTTNGRFWAEGVQNYVDPVETNDTSYSYIDVTDSTFARDYALDTNVVVGSIGIGPAGGVNKRLGQIFTLASPDVLTSVTAYFSAPRINNSITMSVYSVVGGVPSTLLATTAPYQFVQADLLNGKWLTSSLITGPLSLPAGDFFICVNEGDSICGLACTERVFMPGKHFLTASVTTSGNWTDLNLFQARFHRAFVLRANFGPNCAPLTASTTSQPASCGQTNGTASVMATSGVSPHTYTWNTTPPQYTTTATNLAAGSYICTVKDAGGCATNFTVTVSNVGGPTVNVIPTNPLCAGQTGSATASATGGAGGYTYTWSNGTIGQTITNAAPGTYSVTVKDASNCVSVSSVTITAPAQLNALVNMTPATCAGADNGSALVTASGGTPSYTYTWSNGFIGANATNLAPGNYTVTVKDANNCTTTGTVTVTAPPAINTNISSTPSSGSNGTATCTATGGTAPLTYTWNTTPPQYASTATGLAPGTYNCTVVDANGCSKSVDVTVNLQSGIELAAMGIKDFQVYPNPNNGLFNLNVSLQNPSNLKLSIVDMSGKAVFETSKYYSDTWSETFEIRQLAGGLYFVQLATDKGTVSLKLVVE